MAADGKVRRACLAVHERLRVEVEARRAGVAVIGWRRGKPVVRVTARPTR